MSYFTYTISFHQHSLNAHDHEYTTNAGAQAWHRLMRLEDHCHQAVSTDRAYETELHFAALCGHAAVCAVPSYLLS